MSSENTDHLDDFGLECPDGGNFYVCDKAAVNFIGCCTSNPCSDGSGKCPARNLRLTSFSPDAYANIPEQSCDDNRGSKVWYTCSATSPPFLGCCASNPCASGECPRDHLIQAVLSDDEVKRMAFLPPSSTSASSSSSSTTGVPSSTSTPPPSEPEPSGSGLSTGAIAGIAVGGAAVLIIIGLLVWLCRRRARKSNEGHLQPGPEMAYHDNSIPNSPAPYGHIRDSHISSASTAIPYSYHSTPTSPDFAKTQHTHYSHPHYQHPSSPPPLPPGSALHPPSIYSHYAESDNGHHYQPVHPRHLSHMSGVSAMSDPSTTLHTVSEIDGVEQRQRVELPGNDAPAPGYGR